MTLAALLGVHVRSHACAPAALFGLAATAIVTCSANAQVGIEGSWNVSAYTGADVPAACVMTHTDQTNGRLIVFLGERGVERAAYANDALRLTQTKPPTVSLSLDGASAPLPPVEVSNATTVVLSGKDRDERTALMQQLLDAKSITVAVDGQSHTFAAVQSWDAVGALNGCLESGEMSEFARADKDVPDAIATADGDDFDAEAIAALLNKEKAPSPGKNNGEADRLRAALGTMGSAAPMLAQFRCAITGSEIMGIPDINGPGRSDVVSFTLGDDGSVVVNAARLKPVFVDTAGDIQRWVFNAREVLSAIMRQPSDRAPVVGLTAEQQRSYDTVMGTYLPSLTNLVMGDKPRYMLIDLGADAIGFFDLDDANRPANQQAGDCLRVD